MRYGDVEEKREREREIGKVKREILQVDLLIIDRRTRDYVLREEIKRNKRKEKAGART